jgi:PTH1 family peptidyl-tRNA hydrolase
VPTALRLIVGLGNPSSKYEQTRHNAGFWFLDEVAVRHRLAFHADSRFQGLLAKLDFEGETVFLLKPTTFMNRSGLAVAALASYYKIAPRQILVAHDELDFDPGVVRIKVGGGHGGHNGLRDVVGRLGSADFCRLRIGIGHPGDREDVVRYVLDRPSRQEADILRAAVNHAAEFLPDLLRGGIESVMNRLHVYGGVHRNA